MEEAIRLLKEGKFQPALVILMGIIEQNPKDIAAYSNASLCHAVQGEFAQAISLCKKALELDPNNFHFTANLATMYRDTGDLERSIGYYKKALEIKECPEGWSALGLVYWDMRQFSDAEDAFKKALAFDPSNVNMHVNLALLHLMHGRFEEGFKEYLWRVDPNSPMEHYLRCYDQRRQWGGISDISGKRFLVYGEQGLGDVIQFARYLPELKFRGAHVIYHCPETLAELMYDLADETFTKNIEICKATDLPEYDLQCCSMSLPYYLRSYPPSGKPYINTAQPEKFSGGPDCCHCTRPSVAVVWSGNSDHPNDVNRSIPFEEFSKLLEIGDGTRFHSLQFGADKSKFKGNFFDATSGLKTFTDTAGFISGIDLLISCDTSVVHLAGSMGCRCWLLVPYSADWRWGLSDRSCWYDSVVVYRQSKPGDWAGVISKVKKELENFECGLNHTKIS